MEPLLRALALLLIALLCAFAFAQPASSTPLWQIGADDGDTRDLALGPDGWSRYQPPKPFVVGLSEAAKDWPYVMPGPADAWGGSRPGQASVVFRLDAVASEGSARLVLDLVDTHSNAPPTLRIRVNGYETTHSLPGGNSDASIEGRPSAGRPHTLAVPVPVSQLRLGTNLVEIESFAGCWIVWDALRFEAPAGTTLGTATADYTGVSAYRAVRGIVAAGDQELQPVELDLLHAGSPVGVQGVCQGARFEATLHPGRNTVRVLVPAVASKTEAAFAVSAGSERFSVPVRLEPVKRLTLFILNHSHVDVGYTDTQEAVARKQVENLRKAIRLAKETANDPVGSRFVWNVEVGWTADMYRRALGPAERLEFDQAVQNGWLSLEAAYLNVLTGLSHPEELIHLTRYITDEGRRLGVPVRSAMLSDIPGFAWGTVDALAQAGIRYLSVGHNRGYVYLHDRAFWWVSKSGRERVLVWTPHGGYDLCSLIGKLDERFITDLQQDLERKAYPYDMAYVRWNGSGDNAAPEPNATRFARDWNARYAWPKLVVTSTTAAFAAFEAKHGKAIPEMRKEFTQLWEDGAGSTARETKMNRASADRLAQAETLFALRGFSPPQSEIEAAWDAVTLFTEHTWGSFLSIQDPEHEQTRMQWDRKRGLAEDADRRSRGLLSLALNGTGTSGWVEVWNTLGWERSELAYLAAAASKGRDRVLDDRGRPVPSQRLKDGRLAFLAQGIPGFGARRFQAVRGKPFRAGVLAASVAGLSNGHLELRVDPATGAVRELRRRGSSRNVVDASTGHGLNEYLYLAGGDGPERAGRSSRPKITVEESGPLVATLRIESTAPGVRRLVRRVTLAAGLDWVGFESHLDKLRAPLVPGDKSYWPVGTKEAVYIGFPLVGQGASVILDRAFSSYRVGTDNMPDGMNNWSTVGRWADTRSATVAMPDTPLVEVGGIHTRFGADWIRAVPSSAALYVWAMNNHWATNYRAYQEGPVSFRFAVRPHGGEDLAAAARFGLSVASPLLVRAASGAKLPPPGPKVSAPDVLVSGLKRSRDGKAWMVRLSGAGGKDRKATLVWSGRKPKKVWLSNALEDRVRAADRSVDVPGHGIAILRVEW